MRQLIRMLLVIILAFLLVQVANAQTMTVTFGLDTVVNPVQGRLYLTTIAAFRNGRNLENNLVRITGLVRNRRYQVRILAGGSLANTGVVFPLSQININVGTPRITTATHSFRVVSSPAGNQSLGTTGTTPTSTNGLQLAAFETSGPSGNPTVEFNFAMVCRQNTGTANLVPGDDVTPRLYNGLTLRFSLWEFDSDDGWELLRNIGASNNFTLGVRNAIEVVLGANPTVNFRLANAAMYRQNQTIQISQQAFVSSNMPFNLHAFAASRDLETANSTTKIPTAQVAMRVTNTGLGAIAGLQVLNVASAPTLVASNATRGLDVAFSFEYRLTTGTVTLVPGGAYGTNLTIRATQL